MPVRAKETDMRRFSESEWQAFFKRVRPGEEESRLVKSNWTVFWVGAAISFVILLVIAAVSGGRF